jgi:hypothetical protein
MAKKQTKVVMFDGIKCVLSKDNAIDDGKPRAVFTYTVDGDEFELGLVYEKNSERDQVYEEADIVTVRHIWQSHLNAVYTAMRQ